MRTQPASLQTGQRQEGSIFPEPLLSAGPTGMEREERTSPMRFMAFLVTRPSSVPLPRFAALRLPASEDALGVAPSAFVVGHRLGDRVFDPVHGPRLPR